MLTLIVPTLLELYHQQRLMRMSRCMLETKSTRLLSSHWPRARTFLSLALACPSARSTSKNPSSALRRDMLRSFSSPFKRLSSIQRHLKMNAQELKNFLADSPPSTVNLVIKKHFDALTDQQARYGKHLFLRGLFPLSACLLGLLPHLHSTCVPTHSQEQPFLLLKHTKEGS